MTLIDEKAFNAAVESIGEDFNEWSPITIEILKRLCVKFRDESAKPAQPVGDDRANELSNKIAEYIGSVPYTAIAKEVEHQLLLICRSYLRTAPVPVVDTKLIALLEKLSCLGNGELPGNSIGNTMAQEALQMAKNPPYVTAPVDAADEVERVASVLAREMAGQTKAIVSSNGFTAFGEVDINCFALAKAAIAALRAQPVLGLLEGDINCTSCGYAHPLGKHKQNTAGYTSPVNPLRGETSAAIPPKALRAQPVGEKCFACKLMAEIRKEQNTGQPVSGDACAVTSRSPVTNTDGGLSAAERHRAEPSGSVSLPPAQLGDAPKIEPSVAGVSPESDVGSSPVNHSQHEVEK